MQIFNTSFPTVKQLDSQDCGFTCLKIISAFYGIDLSRTNTIFTESNLLKQGISITNLKQVANELGYDSIIVKLDFNAMSENITLPSIFFWNQNHFVVVYKVTKNKVYVSDPAFGKTTYSKKDFLKGWTQDNGEGIIIVLSPTNKLYENDEIIQKKNKGSLKYITQYISNHKTQFTLIAITLLISSIIELIFPFFTQKIIDKGVNQKNISFVYLLLSAQIVLFISRIALEFYRSWLFIHISSRISLSIISDFLVKLMKLPLKYFNSKNIGDLTQRIQDHKRIEEFLSKDLIQSVFSIFSIVIYSAVLWHFNTKIFLIVIFSTILELFWIFSFLKKIKILDHKSFTLDSKDQNKIYELITAMQEVKLNNLENKKREEWEKIQASIYLNNIEKLKVNQQYESYRFISFFQTILVIFVASIAVMNHELTIGSMLAIMFILGGLNSPISQIINFVLQSQLVKVSFERLNEIHVNKDEEILKNTNSIDGIKDISLNNLSFSYNNSFYILKNVTIQIPKEKVTAIVGASGSGKTTLLKLLLKFYNPQIGEILVGNIPLPEINSESWRNKCGVILQDSFLFSNTIDYNISLEEKPNWEKLKTAITLARLEEFVEQLPLKMKTIIGAEGIGISEGQKQRIFIARAIYKNPDYLFFDEATNSLDTKNEKLIVENLNQYFNKKTMIVVAHRLSTVKNADQIIVLHEGKVIEHGNHDELINLNGKYFELIQNQLELTT